MSAPDGLSATYRKPGRSALKGMLCVLCGIGIGTIIATFKGGGSGWGDSFAGNPHKVLDDVPDEHVRIEQAEKQNGVVIDSDTLKVDMEETIRRRARMAK